MSIYSGFATRNLQQSYDQHVCDLLFVLQKRILKFYQNVQTDEDKFFVIISQLYHQMLHLEKSKYLEPKSSVFINEMYQYLKSKKQERSRDPEVDLKKFQRSLALNKSNQEQLKRNEIEINNFIRRSSFSFGKIKKQLSSGKCLKANSQSINKKNEWTNTSFQTKNQNPEDIRESKEKRMFSSKGVRKTSSFHGEILETFKDNRNLGSESQPARQIVKEYLQKTNKNYLRGYRKRKIKDQYDSAGPHAKILIRERANGK